MGSSTLDLDSRYYEFAETGTAVIDRILEAVALAGRAYHNTVDWNSDTSGYGSLDGLTPVEWIQNAANAAAADIQEAYKELLHYQQATVLHIRENQLS